MRGEGGYYARKDKLVGKIVASTPTGDCKLCISSMAWLNKRFTCEVFRLLPNLLASDSAVVDLYVVWTK